MYTRPQPKDSKMAICSLSVLRTGAVLFVISAALEPPCSRLSPGTNIIVRDDLTVSSEQTGKLPELPDGTPMMTYGHKSECSGLDGTIVVGGPLSMSAGNAYYGYSTMMRKSIQIFLDWLNDERGGVVVNGSRYAMKFHWVNDDSSKQQVTNATAHAIREAKADFAMAGYSSGLTKYATQQSFADGRLLLAAGAASASVYAQNNLTFGTLGPASSYLTSSLAAIKEAAIYADRTGASNTALSGHLNVASSARGRCGPAGCLASLKMGLIQADALFTKSVCATLPSQAKNLGYAFGSNSAPATVPKRPSVEQVVAVLEKFRAEGITVIFGCTYYDTGIAIIEALEKMDWTPLAVVLTSTVGMPAYSARIAEGWWQGEYWLGPTPWHPTGEVRGEFSKLTSSEFAELYRKRYGTEVAYQGASQFAACCALATAIESAGSLDTHTVATALQRLRLSEFFTDLAFDRTTGQNNAMEFLVVQYAPESNADHVVYPARHVVSGSFEFPTPSWAQRRCRASSRSKGTDDSLAQGSGKECSGHGFCNDAGSCVCEGDWDGSTCNHRTTTEETGLPGWGVALVVAGCVLLATCALLALRRHKNLHIGRKEKEIKTIQDELQNLKDNAINMKSVVSDYLPSSSLPSLLTESPISAWPARSPRSPKERAIWYWAEDASRLSSHNQQQIMAPHWVQYAGSVAAEMEGAYQSWRAGEGPASHATDLVDRISSTGTEKKAFASESGTKYVIDFESMKQLNAHSGYERGILRHVKTIAPDIDVSISFSTRLDAESSRTPSELEGETLLELHAGSIVQMAKKREDIGWGFGSVIYNERASKDQTDETPLAEGVSRDSGWFPLACVVDATREALKKLNERMGGGGADCLALPPTWSQLKDPLVAELVALDDGFEKQEVIKRFLSSLKPDVRIVKVERVQNVSLWQSFAVKRQTLLSREKNECSTGVTGSRFEKVLFHGTTPDTVPKILQQGFNRSFCGKNATMFGKGVYFARDASYSFNYAPKDSAGIKKMFLCRVVHGEFCQGVKDALAPDVRNAGQHLLYDSTVDNTSDPSIYVTYHDAQAYPEYLVHFAC